MNQAALKAGIDGVSSVNMSHLNYAKDKILMGKDNCFHAGSSCTDNKLIGGADSRAFRYVII